MEQYFAYGSNMSVEQMTKRCPSARFLGRAILREYRLDFPRRSKRWNGGVAGVVPDSASSVEGVVYEISEEDLPILDEYEGVPEGRYRRTSITVTLEDGTQLEAWTYFANPEAGGPFASSKEYLETMLKGAKQQKLSPQYIQELSKLAEEPGD